MEYLSDETRDAYFKLTRQHIEANWLQIMPFEFEMIYDHVLNYDFPESYETLNQLGMENGFLKGQSLFRDKNEFYELLLFDTKSGCAAKNVS